MMKKITITVYDADNTVVAGREGAESAVLHLERIFQPGDRVEITAQPGTFLNVFFQGVGMAQLYFKNDRFIFPIPFGEERLVYVPGTFDVHSCEIFAQYTTNERVFRNLSVNPLDTRGETGVFPHCTATVETRGEAVFAARNTIDGNLEADGHGGWPFTSWGEGEDPGAEIKIEFGRPVEISEVWIYLRADFPHDNYWESAVLEADNGAQLSVKLKPVNRAQRFLWNPGKISWLKMKNMQKNEENPSPFPALTQWSVWGRSCP